LCSSITSHSITSFLAYLAEGKTKSQQLLAPEIVRALTELFLVVENQAEVCLDRAFAMRSPHCLPLLPQVWGVSQDMVIETLTKEGLHTWLEKGRRRRKREHK